MANEKHQHDNYHGLRYARHKIAELIPHGIIFVEPFGGHAWVSREVCKKKAKKCVIGDIDPEPLEWAKKYHKLNNAIFKVQDWKKTVAQTDSPNTVFLFDPPWNTHSCTPKNPRPGACGKNFYPEIIETAKRLKGRSIIAFPITMRKQICPKVKECKIIKVKQGKLTFKYGVAIVK
ncbi:MAG: hypothetical protein QXO15_05275 [Nitrososphaerota archaeon]